jgi:Domain of unknown function (DUF222)
MREQASAAELIALGEQIAEQAVHLDAAMHRLLADLRRFDEAGGWLAQHFSSCAHWLSHRVGWDLATSREHLRVARSLFALPAVDAALAAGKLSYSKARAITRVATAANEPILLQYAEVSTASQLETICRKLHAAERREADPRQALPRDDDRYVVASATTSGLVCVKAFLLPDEAALLMQALQRAARDCKDSIVSCEHEGLPAPSLSPSPADASAEPCATSQHVSAEVPACSHPDDRKLNRADGLMALVHSYVRGDSVNRSPIEMIVTTPAETLRAAASCAQGHAVTEAFAPDAHAADPAHAAQAHAAHAASTAATPHDRGASIAVAIVAETSTYLSPDTARRLACDCGLVEATVDAQGQPLSVGRKTRAIPAALKRALLLRDRTCRFPGCDHRLFLDGHHLQHWADGGETSLSNTLLLCTAHHARVHEHGYRIVPSAHGELRFFDSRGKAVVAVPPRPAPQDLGWPAIRAANAASCPLPLFAETSIDVDRQGRLDHREAVDRLLRLTPRPSRESPSQRGLGDRHHVGLRATAPAASASGRDPVPAASAAASKTMAPPGRAEDFADPDYDFVAAGHRADDLLEWSMEELLATGIDPMATVPAPIWPPPSWYQSKQREVPGPAWATPPSRRDRVGKSRSSAAVAPQP